jgi:dihydroorotate dehydrogenase
VIDQLYRLARPALFRFDPETVHDRVIATLGRVSTSRRALDLLRRRFPAPDPRLTVVIGNATLPGPVGIAAGLDKNGVAYPALTALGWDSVEIGTITPQPQPGNPKPRVFRLSDDRALINRMGFPGEGADAIAMHLVQRRGSGAAIGCNIGPNKASVEAGLDAVVADCARLAARYASTADYLVVNVSSPNTARLRDLQGKDALRVLLAEVKAAIPARERTPLLVKIAPDLTAAEISDIVAVVTESGLDGIVATNTTIARPPNLRSRGRGETGGLSGRPLRDRSLAVVRQITLETGGSLPVIAVGGISSGADTLAAIRAGAWAVQIYTGMIYEGPGLARAIKRELIRELDRVGATTLADLRQHADRRAGDRHRG